MANKSVQNLIIVESPTKTHTIGRLLGKDYKIMASVGHVADLPVKELGVDVEKGFEPKYETIRGKVKVLSDLKKAANAAERVYLAPDPDREGEAIAWHVAQAINQPDEKVWRITFDEITARGVKNGLDNPRKIDMSLFDAQQARRILDRLVGYKISPLLWKKIKRGLSAGRVQSVAVRLVCEREDAIRAFVAEEYWSIDAEVEGPKPPVFPISLDKIRGEKGEDRQWRRRAAHRQRSRPRPAHRHERRKERRAAQSRRALHHLHAAAGGRAQAALHREEDDDGRPAPL